MGCCSPAPRSLVIETTVARVEGETRNRRSDTVEAARSAAKDLETVLLPLNVRVTLVEHAATTDEIDASHSVMINGRPIGEWLGEDQESFTVDQIRDAAFAAIGTGEAGGCC